MDYQEVTVPGNVPVGVPAPLPLDLVGLADVSLADLTPAIGVPAATQLGYLNTGYLPVPPPSPTPHFTVSAGALRIALDRVGLLNDFNSAVNGLSQEFDLWWDHQPTFTLGSLFILAVMAEAGPPLSDDMEAVFVAAASVEPE
jgi:hypothetical protein